MTVRSSSDQDVMIRVACSVPEDLHAKLSHYAAVQRPKLSQAAVVLKAVEDAYTADELAQLGTQTEANAVSSDLFTHIGTRPVASPKVTLDLRFHSQDLVVLDELWRQAGARNRTQFVIAALTRFLRGWASESAV